MVTGNSALQVDLSSKLQSRMPWFIAAVLLLSLLVLIPVFRSVWVPLKAAALNLISIGASYGVLVAIFQWGWGAEWFGIHETMPINPLAPMLMFAILFGLSMDYEVFLLGRVREEYRLSRRPPGQPDRRRDQHGARHHQRGPDHDQRLLRVRAEPGHHEQAVRARARHRRTARRDAGADGAGPGGDEPARPPRLAPPVVAGPDPARHRPGRSPRLGAHAAADHGSPVAKAGAR